MAENKLKERWKAGKAAVNGWLAIPSGFSAEVMAQCGWDSVTVENSHHGATYPVGRLPERCVTSSIHLSSTTVSCSRVIAIGFSWE